MGMVLSPAIGLSKTAKNIIMKLSTIITLALVGTAITLLFTTEKGAEYRYTAMDGAKKLGKKIRRQAEAAADAAPILKDHLVEAMA